MCLHPRPYFIEAEALCAAKRFQRTEMWRTSGLNYGRSTILEKFTQFTGAKVFMPSDHTARTYHFNMRYKVLVPDREQCWNGLPLQLDSSRFFIYCTRVTLRKIQAPVSEFIKKGLTLKYQQTYASLLQYSKRKFLQSRLQQKKSSSKIAVTRKCSDSQVVI